MLVVNLPLAQSSKADIRSRILRFGARINKSLFDIHVGVPQFNEKMLLSVERTLERFQPNQPFERSSWEMVDDYNMYHRECFIQLLTSIF